MSKKHYEFTISTKESGKLHKVKFKVFHKHSDMVANIKRNYDKNVGDWIGGYYNSNKMLVILNAETVSLGIISHECTHIAETIRDEDVKEFNSAWKHWYNEDEYKREMLAYVSSDLISKTVAKIQQKELRLFTFYAEKNYPYLLKGHSIGLTNFKDKK